MRIKSIFAETNARLMSLQLAPSAQAGAVPKQAIRPAQDKAKAILIGELSRSEDDIDDFLEAVQSSGCHNGGYSWQL
ncbi:hypothetical protein [Labrys sp. WJW]|uniref:hypothetical protein n=1 Tax=Labrys sp. WJW TaxID=1737983 RepID=UPI0012E9B33A|nr:hypothetical protein [Labrys sp. WJW]